jgi:hypothetical protein
MSHLSPNTIKLSTATKQIDLAFMRPLQRQYLHDEIFKSISASDLAADQRITVVPAGTNAGKSTVITKITIPHVVYLNSSVQCIIFTSPDSGCVDGPYHKFHAEWNGKRITCADGTVKQFRARRKDDIKFSWLIGEATSDDIVDVWFISTQWLRQIWGEYSEPLAPKLIGVPQYIFVDEIHFGMGTIDATTIFLDQGRNNKNFDPKWLPTIYGMAIAGSRVIGYTGTATVSQQGGTILGAGVFKSLTKMPENKNTSVFADILPIKTDLHSSTYRSELLNTYDLSKLVYELSVDKCDKFIREIDVDTWEKALDIGIVQVMPGAFFKFGRTDATKSIPLYTSRGRLNDFVSFGKDLDADIGIVTSDDKTYTKPGQRGFKFKEAYSIIKQANHPINIVNPFLLSVIMQGNMGWDIPRLKQISFLGYPSAKNVFLMQLQTMARAKRLLCDVYDHTDKAREIAELDISIEQKILLAKFVVFVNTVNIVIPNDAPLLDRAYDEFRINMHTPNQGLNLYLDIINTHVPVKKNNVSKMTKPHFNMGYNPGSQNQANKKDYCEHCTNLGLVNDKGVTLCKVLGRALADNLESDLTGVNLTDGEFENHWKGSLKLDHLNSDRTDNRPENLYTRCGISDALKTLINKDFLGKYDANGNKASNS